MYRLSRLAWLRPCLIVAAVASTLVHRQTVSGETISALPLDFARDVFGVMQRSCFECHGPNRQEAGLRLDRKTELLEAGIVETGDPESSELIRRITLPRNHDEVMPVVGDPLTQAEVSAISRWIADGATWPDGFTPPEHWAYVAPMRPKLPDVSAVDWVSNPIDRFVLARLDSLDLSPSAPADEAVLLRRVSLDLIGLPPTLEEIKAFEADTEPGAFGRVVDDLLSRPQFGQRWARPWLDLARYADSHGFQRDDFRDLWAYRDWVIDALNEDMPFDQFTIEQLAGDLIPNATPSQRIATGFHRCAPTNVEAGSLPEETRSEQVIDRVNTTASVWLGSTLECAQCHDHKFDPFSIKEYYQFLAFFNHTAIEADLSNPNKPSSIGFVGASMTLPDPQREAERNELTAQRNRLNQQLAERKRELDHDWKSWSTRWKSKIQNAPRTHGLDVIEFDSLGATDSFEIRDDRSVLLVGSDPPSVDRYTILAKLSDAEPLTVSAIRLDVLTDPSLPGTGPGRGDPKRNNFVLNEFTATLVDEDNRRRQLEFDGARADFSQAKYQVVGAIDGDPKTAWAIAPQFSRAHHATFLLSEPMELSESTQIEFKLHQNFGGARTIGCFRLSVLTGDVDQESPPESLVKLAMTPMQEWSATDRKTMLEYRASSDSVVETTKKQINAINQQLKGLTLDTTEIMAELDTPRPMHVFQRGDYRSPGESVRPDVPGCLHPLEPNGGSGAVPGEHLDRLDLARWLVDPDNPLVARVTVNRWWMELFGEGLVRTPEDFGLKGARPTHPGVLDWLAVEFVENGWSMKHILKLIVMSSTYQQSSVFNDTLLAMDDQNRHLARGPRFRMNAEMIRDNALAVSGLISLKSGGPPIRPYQPEGLWKKVGGQDYPYVISPGDEKYRRGVYVVIKRGAPYPSFVNFDASNRFACTVQRSRSNTPLQALTLLNDPVYVEVAKAMAVRAASAATSSSVDSTITSEFRRVVARQPEPTEVEALSDLWQIQTEKLEQDPGDADRLADGVVLPPTVTKPQFAAWYAVTTVLLNLHETITKE